MNRILKKNKRALQSRKQTRRYIANGNIRRTWRALSLIPLKLLTLTPMSLSYLIP